MQISFYSGVVLGYTAGTFLDYHTLPLVLIVLPIVFFSIFLWMPHTPQYLVKAGDFEVSFESIRSTVNAFPN